MDLSEFVAVAFRCLLFASLAPLASASTIALPGDLDGDGLVDQAILNGDRVVVRSSSAGIRLQDISLPSDLRGLHLLHLPGPAHPAQVAVLGRRPDGTHRIERLDTLGGEALGGTELPGPRRYLAFDRVDRHDTQGRPLLALWNEADNGSLAVDLRLPSGAPQSRIEFGTDLHLVDTGIAQLGERSLMLALVRHRLSGRNELRIRALDGEALPNLRYAPGLVLRDLAWLQDSDPRSLGRVAVTGISEFSALGQVVVRALDAPRSVQRLRLGRSLRPIALSALDVPGQASGFALLTQRNDLSKVLVHDANGQVSAMARLPRGANWTGILQGPPTSARSVLENSFLVDRELAEGPRRTQLRTADRVLADLRYASPLRPRPRETLDLQAVRDATLYESASGVLANGSGQHWFAGRTSQGNLRRGLIRFEPQHGIPAGSKILGGQLNLNLSKTRTPNYRLRVHLALANWSEGVSDAGGEEGRGTMISVGDAGWLHRDFPALQWSRPGGDFSSRPRSEYVLSDGANQLELDPALLEDLQRWLDVPADNRGWVLLGDEAGDGRTMRFDSRTHPLPQNRPRLLVEYLPP